MVSETSVGVRRFLLGRLVRLASERPKSQGGLYLLVRPVEQGAGMIIETSIPGNFRGKAFPA